VRVSRAWRGGGRDACQIGRVESPPLVLEHAFKNSGALGNGRALVPEDALDLKDVEREVLAADLERDQLDVVTVNPLVVRSWYGSPSASRSRIGTNRPRAPYTRPPGQRLTRGHGQTVARHDRIGRRPPRMRPACHWPRSSTRTTVRTRSPPPRSSRARVRAREKRSR